MLKASTIIESIVAMVIIAISMLIGVSSFATLISIENLPKKLKAHEAIEQAVLQLRTDDKLFDEKIIAGEIEITKSVEQVGSNGLVKITILARNKQKKIIEEFNAYIIANE